MGGKNRIDFYGSSELLKKLEAAGANVEQCVIDALQKSVEKPKQEMYDYMKAHTRKGDYVHTIDSFTTEIKKEGDKVFVKVGFDIKKGGLPAVFLNYGTPRIQPSFFIDKAIDDNIDEIKRAQLEALNKAFKGLK